MRFASLSPAHPWTVQDPLSDLCYAREGRETLWDTEDLQQGLVLSMEKRSEAWLLLSPPDTDSGVEPTRTVFAGAFKSAPDRPRTEGAAPTGSSPAGANCLVYTKTDLIKGRNAVPEQRQLQKLVMGTLICAIDSDGGNEQELFGIEGSCWSPTWSPDGTLVAFSCYVNGKGQLYVMNADGSDVCNVSNNEFCDHSPAWSPDGSRLVFVSDRQADWEIYVMNADGGQQRRLIVFDVPVYVFADDDGIIDDETESHYQGEHTHHIKRVAGEVESEDRAKERDRDSQGNPERQAHTQE